MTGAAILLRSHLRRDWLVILCWCLGLTLLYWSQGASVQGLYTTQAEFDRAAASMEANVGFVAMTGPPRALNTVGGQVVWQSAAFGAVLAGLMSMFLIGRHTRAEEESGRDEMVRSAAVGRRAPLVAALGVAAVANVLAGLLVTASLVALSLDVADSVGAGLGLTMVGWAFSGTALVAAQLTQSTRGMYGIAGSVIGAAYVLRAAGDVSESFARWLSPIGWYQAMHPFSGLRWWPGLLCVTGALAATALAFALFGRRDIGSGLLADRAGPSRAGGALASGGLRGALGLAWRLQRGLVTGWAAGMLLCGLAYGSIGDSVGDLVGDSEAAEDLFVGAGDLVDGFFATAIIMLGLIGAGFAVSSALTPRAEESRGHAEAVLATALERRSWLGAHALVTLVGTLVVLAAAGLGLGVGYALTTGEWSAVSRLGIPVLAQAAPVLVISGVARLLYGVLPRAVLAAWLVLGLCVVVLMLGDLLRLPQWLQGLSPFEHLALVPAESFRWLPFLAVTAIAALLSVVGQFTFTRRDIG